MFEQFSVNNEVTGQDVKFYISWRWVKPESDIRPSCKLFIYYIPEDRLFDRFLFTAEEIVDYFQEIGIPLLDTATGNRETAITAFWSSSARENCCNLDSFSLNYGDALPYSHTRTYSNSVGKVFLFCIYDTDGNFSYKIVFPYGEDIKCNRVTESRRLTDFFRGNHRNSSKIELKNTNGKRCVMVTKDSEGSKLYTVLPKGTVFSIENFDENNTSFIFLSSLIGF